MILMYLEYSLKRFKILLTSITTSVMVDPLSKLCKIRLTLKIEKSERPIN